MPTEAEQRQAILDAPCPNLQARWHKSLTCPYCVMKDEIQIQTLRADNSTEQRDQLLDASEALYHEDALGDPIDDELALLFEIAEGIRPFTDPEEPDTEPDEAVEPPDDDRGEV